MRGFGQRDHVFPRMHDAAALSVLSEPFQKYLATRMPAARRANDLYRLVGRIVLREEYTAAAVRTFRFFPHGESPNPRAPVGTAADEGNPHQRPCFRGRRKRLLLRPNLDLARPDLRAFRDAQREDTVLEARVDLVAFELAAQRESALVARRPHVGVDRLHVLRYVDTH